MMHRRLPALAAAVALTTAAAAQQGRPAPDPLVKENTTIKVSPHVYVIPDASVPLVPNVGIVVGSRATLIVDTGLGPRNGQAILREAAKVSGNATMYVVSTHFHPENALGEAAFPATAKVIRARAQQLDIEEFGLMRAREIGEGSPAARALVDGVEFRRADIVFARSYLLDLGGVQVTLLALGPTHTRGDTGVFVDGDRVLFSGDVVVSRAFLAFASPYASLGVWLNSLDRLERLQPMRIVPGHGPMGARALLGEDRDYLLTVQRRVLELSPSSESIESLIERMTMEMQTAFPGWTGAEEIAGAVTAAYSELREVR
jgi:glyoxylase-like metal-dependent hydrolase (beta-lactamase superfamily II)